MSEKEENRQRSLPAATGQQMSLERRASAPVARTTPRPRAAPASTGSRLVPLSVAGLLCFLTAILLGGGSWYLFGMRERNPSERARQVTQLSATPQP